MGGLIAAIQSFFFAGSAVLVTIFRRCQRGTIRLKVASSFYDPVVHKLGREAESSNFEINLVPIQNCSFSQGNDRFLGGLGGFRRGFYVKNSVFSIPQIGAFFPKSLRILGVIRSCVGF